MTIEELKPYGLEEMRTEQIEQFLESQSVGVLGLPTGGVPYMVPLSYAYDGDSTLYFTYVLGAESKKEEVTSEDERAQFLVYSADTMFNWQSVLLDGTFERVPPSEWDDIADVLEDAWRPEIFKTADTARNVKIYAFEFDELSGLRHSGLSPQYE